MQYKWRLDMPKGKMSDEQKRKISEANKKRHAEKKAAKEAKEVEAPEVSIEQEMAVMDEAGQDAIKQQVIQDAIAAALAELSGEKSKVRIDKNKCTRHPHEDVKPGENCQKCIVASQRHAQRMKLAGVLPCPKCGDNVSESRGGTIKTFQSKNGMYSCGNCEIDYTVKGEISTWQSGGAQRHVSNEILYRKRRGSQGGHY